MTSDAVPHPAHPAPVLSDTVRLVRSGRDPRTTITVDHSLPEVVALYLLTHAGYAICRWSPEVLDPVDRGVIQEVGGWPAVMDTASTRLFLALHRFSVHGLRNRDPRSGL